MYQDYNQIPPYGQPYNQEPQYYQRQVSFGEAISRGLSNYCNFEGRASRSEYWWFQLFIFIIGSPFAFIAGFMEGMGSDLYIVPQIIYYLIVLALLLPQLGLFVRRMHDIGKSGWWYFLNFLCCVGPIILLVWEIKDSDPVENEYGPVPNLEPIN
ncbi:MAG: DUF805 domain-containing protein [Muribaculaceae bacterium]|nr:DUF805 domain-containing protein [Muribaculaceae bacterium]